LRGAPTRIYRLAATGLWLTQFLAEPGWTLPRAGFVTGRNSTRFGLSPVAVEGTAIALPAQEVTMAEMLRNATAIFGKWHLGSEPHSQRFNSS
jgi:arylsulfatase A-like enzyme